ncbi:MAG: protein kinase [Candidatus Krumholzibacteriota bacterium]|nr:protein kinase [Candidatus Krumholzibacteriota bacterium]
MEHVNRLPQRYTIIDIVGEGGNGVVYRVHDADRDAIGALKVLTHVSPGEAARLVDEFRTLSSLGHEHLVSVFDLDRTGDGIPFFTMEYIEGLPLDSFLGSTENPAAVPTVLHQALQALAYLHGRRILHGDIKPENIMIVRRDGSIDVKLLDFGLVRRPDETGRAVSGTKRFLAPEILRGEPYTAATDIYALGMTLYECIAGRTAPIATAVDDEWIRVAEEEMNGALARTGTPRHSAIARFLSRLPHPDPAVRTGDCGELADRLALLTGMVDPAANPVPEGLFVDREEIVDRIEREFLAEGAAKSLLALLGPAGVGRKSIMRETLRRAQLAGYATISFLETLGAPLTISVFVDRLSRALDPAAAGALAAELDQAGAEAADRRTGAAGGALFYDIVARAVDGLARRRPLVVALPDIDCAQGDVAPFLAHLAGELSFLGSPARLLVSAGGNAPSADTPLARVLSSDRALRIEVAPFGRRETQLYLDALFLGDLFSERGIDRLVSISAGLPAALRGALLRCVRERILVHEEGSWRLDQERFIAAKIRTGIGEGVDVDSLDDGAAALLAAIHLWQAPIPLEILDIAARALGVPVTAALQELTGRGAVATGEEGTVALAHAIDPAAIEGRVPEARRMEIARTLLRIAGNNTRETPPRTRLSLALQAGNADEAIAAGIEHADRLRANNDLFEAAAVLEEILPIAEKSVDRDRILGIRHRLAGINILLGRSDEALAHLGIVADIAPDSADRFLALLDAGKILTIYKGNAKDGKRRYEQALDTARSLKDRGKTAKALLYLADHPDTDTMAYLDEALVISEGGDIDTRAEIVGRAIYHSRLLGQPEGIADLLTEAHSLVERVEDTVRLKLSDQLANYYFYQGDYNKTIEITERDLAFTKESNRWLKHIDYLRTLGGCYYVKGLYTKMIELLKEGVFLGSRFNDSRSILINTSNILLAYIKTAQYGEAIEQAARIAGHEDYTSFSRQAPHITQKIAHLYLLLGTSHKERFESALAESTVNAEAAGNNITLGHARLLEGRSAIQQLLFEEALAPFDEALALFEKTDDRDDIVEALSWRALALAELGRRDEAVAATSRADEIYGKIHCDYQLPLLGLARGTAAAEGKEALGILAAALHASEGMQTAEITWMIQREIARRHVAANDIFHALRFFKDAVETLKRITETIDDEETRFSCLTVPLRRRVFDEIKDLKRSIG